MKSPQPSQPQKQSGQTPDILLSLVIPCYNESMRVDLMMQGLAEFEERWKGRYEVIIVDDGSKDDTVQKTEAALNGKYAFLAPKVLVERMPTNGGKGSALKHGVAKANGDYILTLDADMSTRPAELILWEKREKSLFNGAPAIYIGSRKHEDGKVEALKSRRFIGGIFNGVVQLFTTLQLKDTQCGFKLYSGDVAKFLFGQMQSTGWSHDVELLYQADLNGIAIVEMPVNWVNQPESKVNVVKDSAKMFFGVLAISFRTWLRNSFVLLFKISPHMSPEQRANIKGRSMFNILALLLVIAMPLLSFGFGVSGDEHWHFDYGNSIYNYFFHGDNSAQTADSGIQFYGGLFDFLVTFVFRVFHPWDHYTTMHFINAIVGAIGIIYAGKLAKVLAGWNAGTIAMVLLVLSPSWFGHNFANPKDIPFSAGYTAGIYFMLLFLRSLPEPGVRQIVGLIASIGWAMGVRIGGLLLIAYLVLFIIVYAVYTKQTKVALGGKVIKKVALVAIAGYIIAILPWPYVHENIITKPLEALKVMSNFIVNIPILYDGNRMMSNQVPWYYIPRYMAYTMPLIVMLGIALGLFAVFHFRKDKQRFIFSLFVLFSILFPWAYAVYKHSSLYDGWRHFLFVYPPLVAIVAGGWAYFISSANKGVKYLSLALLIAGLALPAKFMAAEHPYESLYYNELAGGLKGVYGKFDTDYYMLGVREATNWLLEHEHPGKGVTIGTNTTFPMVAAMYQHNRKNLPAKYQDVYEEYAAFEHNDHYLATAKQNADFKDAFDPGVVYVHYNNRYSKDWDYYIGFSRYLDAATLKAGGWPPEETIYTVKVDGVPIAAVLKRKTKKDLAGLNLMKEKRYEEAKYMFLGAVHEYPGNEAAWAELARIYEAEGKADSAIYAGQQVLKKTPADINTLQTMGSVYVKAGTPEKAMALFKSVEQYSPSVSHFLLGYGYAITGNAQAAYNELDLAIAADPYNEQPYRLAMQIAQQTKDMSRMEDYNSRAQKVFGGPEQE
ncbi:MAG: glycosyltransferase [Taibaiella sp.]|nr:glycosyltransferase [Taibaiella sp.]